MKLSQKLKDFLLRNLLIVACIILIHGIINGMLARAVVIRVLAWLATRTGPCF